MPRAHWPASLAKEVSSRVSEKLYLIGQGEEQMIKIPLSSTHMNTLHMFTHTCSYTLHTHIQKIPGVIDGTNEIVYIPIVCSSVFGKFCYETLTFICCDASAGDSRGLSLS